MVIYFSDETTIIVNGDYTDVPDCAKNVTEYVLRVTETFVTLCQICLVQNQERHKNFEVI